MNRSPLLAAGLLTAAINAWWDAWEDFWAFFGDQNDPDYQRDERSIERNSSIHESGGDRGTFYSAGVGSDGD